MYSMLLISARHSALLGSLALSAAFGGSSLAAQQLTGMTLFSPLPTSTFAPAGQPDLDITPAGPIPNFFFQRSATDGSGFTPNAAANVTLNGLATEARIQTGVFSEVAQGSAVVGPLDVRFNYSFASPSLVQLEVITYLARFDGSTAQNLDIDIGADGSVDYTVAPVAFDPSCQGSPDCVGATDPVVFPLPQATTSVSVRVTGSLVAVGDSFAEFDVAVRLAPRVQCAPTEIAQQCFGTSVNQLLVGTTFEGDTLFRLIAPNQGVPPAMVFGFATSPLVLPLGGCVLTPTPNIVVPMSITSAVLAELSVPPITSGLPLTYYAQALSLDLNGTDVLTSRAFQMTCP